MIHRLDIRHYHFSENTSAGTHASARCCVVRGRGRPCQPVMSRMNAASASADAEMGGRSSLVSSSSGAAVHL